MAGAGKKTFTAGEILTASDTNTYLMEQTVMYFAGTAARASAIPTPSTGMTTYIGTTGTATIPQIETYTGSAWQTPYGLTQVANVSFTTAATVDVSNVFTSTYRNYVLYILSTGTASVGLRLQYLKAGTPRAANYYGGILYSNFSGGSGQVPMSNVAQATIGTIGTTGSFTRVEIGDANLVSGVANSSYLVFQSVYAAGGEHAVGGVSVASDTYDGFRLTPQSSTMTGSVRVYGIRNS
jgi:hypothetical protein